MFRKAILVVTCVILLWQVYGIFNEALAQAEPRLDNTESFWVQLWNSLKEHPFIFSMIIVTSITIFSTVMATIKKDNLLKGLAGHLVTIELKDGARHRGRLRVESEGLEVVAEKANEGNEKVSYLLRKDEMEQIHALIRYHDFLTDREKEERNAEVDRVYHPSIGMRLKRRTRNIVNEFKRVATDAFTIVFGRIKQELVIDNRDYGKEVESAGKEAVTYATAAAYDTLIDRLIGTKVVVRVANKDQEYIGVLKDYTGQFIELLDVRYKNAWQIVLERGKNSIHERGLILRKDGDDVVIQSKSPFKLTLKNIYWREEAPEAKLEKINKTIEPFGELRFRLMPPTLDLIVSPFSELRLPTSIDYRKYKKIFIHFESVRIADIVMLKKYGIVRNRTEKFEPKLLDFGSLADSLLTNKGEELVLEGNPSATPLTIYNGYLTNLPEERMDEAEVNEQLSQRWDVTSFFASLDRKLRPTSRNYFLGILPLRKARKVRALLALLTIIHADEKRKRDPLLPLIYYALCRSGLRKKRRSIKNKVLIKKKSRILQLLTRLRPTTQV